MTSLDAVFIVIFIIFFARGLWTGLVSQLAFFAALVLGFIAAGNFYETLAPFVQKIIAPPQIAFFATFTVLFLIVYFAVIASGKGLKKVAKVSLLGWFDRAMGGMLGLGKAVLLSTLIFMILSGVLSHSNAFLRKAYLYPFFAQSSRGVLQFVKDKDLRDRFQPKDPAISSLFALQSQIASQTEKRMLASRKEKIQQLREQLAREARERNAKRYNVY